MRLKLRNSPDDDDEKPRISSRRLSSVTPWTFLRGRRRARGSVETKPSAASRPGSHAARAKSVHGAIPEHSIACDLASSTSASEDDTDALDRDARDGSKGGGDGDGALTVSVEALDMEESVVATPAACVEAEGRRRRASREASEPSSEELGPVSPMDRLMMIRQSTTKLVRQATAHLGEAIEDVVEEASQFRRDVKRAVVRHAALQLDSRDIVLQVRYHSAFPATLPYPPPS